MSLILCQVSLGKLVVDIGHLYSLDCKPPRNIIQTLLSKSYPNPYYVGSKRDHNKFFKKDGVGRKFTGRNYRLLVPLLRQPASMEL